MALIGFIDNAIVCEGENFSKMLNKFAKFLLVSTSLSPILLTMWFINFSKRWKWLDGSQYLLISFFMLIICFLFLLFSKKHLGSLSVEIVEVKTADKEILGFF